MAKVKKVGEIYKCEVCSNVVEVNRSWRRRVGLLWPTNEVRTGEFLLGTTTMGIRQRASGNVRAAILD